WLDAQKKRQLIQVISNSWWIYLNSLIQRKNGNIIYVDLIKYIDAYKRFFLFLSKLDDFHLFKNFFINLLKRFIAMGDELSTIGITKFINSFAYRLKEKEEYLELIELQLLLMFLRKTVLPTDFYNFSMELLGKTLVKLEPNKRALFLYVFIENINIKYQLMKEQQELEVSQNFVRALNKILTNRIPNYLKEDFSKLGRVEINQRNFDSIFEDLEDLIYYMNNLSLDNWIIIIVRYLFSKIDEFQSFESAINYAKRFIAFSISRNKFEMAFATYDFLEEVLMYKSDIGYSRVLIEWWMDACNEFLNNNEKFLLLSLEKLNNHLKMPYKSSDVFHFFYSCNYLWLLKSRFFQIESQDFWRMMFYRALFEEKDFNLAEKIIPQLETELQTQLSGLKALYDGANLSEMKKYSFEEQSDNFQTLDTKFIIKQMILRIDSKGAISYRIKSQNDKIIEGNIINEFWNDDRIIEIYDDFFLDKLQRKFNFTLMEFGRLLYIFLPKLIREFLINLNDPSSKLVPQIYFVLDKMTIPFQLIYDDNFFMLKNSSSYKIGEHPLGGILFENGLNKLDSAQTLKKYNVLVIESINSRGPVKWSEKKINKELLFPYSEGLEELKYIVNFFNSRSEVNQIEVLTGRNSTREKILSALSQGPYHIIHIIGNIFYSKSNPKDSLFLTNDNNKVTFNEIFKALTQNRYNLQPLICCNTQVFDINGKRLKNIFREFGEITAQFDYDRISGIISRNFPIFNDESKELIINFYINIFKEKSQGIALLNARQEGMAKNAAQLAELRWTADEELMKILLAMSSYELYGKPWKKL
ncbi:MAG: CHAT domain-containing protein, partial [Promethearchaeota archaeon]